MKEIILALSEIQPSQLYVSQTKLNSVSALMPNNYECVPVKRLNGQIIFTDGHTRALALYRMGKTHLCAIWDEDELDWEAYEICVAWCNEEGIFTIADLNKRVLDDEQYALLWDARCDRMHEALALKRAKL